MGRSVNIEPIKLHNISVFDDAIKIRYDSNKTDQTGESCTYKHVYANPLNPWVCSFLSMGIYMAINSDDYENDEHFFHYKTRNTNKKKETEKVSSKRYCIQLSQLLSNNIIEVRNYVRAMHANAHGIRKGSATYATSGTTMPPPLPSVASRGEWSLGKVLDVYWHFSNVGDCYLGRVLAGIDPNHHSFGILPPHFVVEDPMSNQHVREAMLLMYGPILKRWADTSVDPTGLLLRLLASVVHHSDWIKSIANKDPSHCFNDLPLILFPKLLDELKTIVSTEPSAILKKATGIPPHIEQSMKTRKILTTVTDILSAVNNQFVDFKKLVHEAFEERDLQNGQVSGARLQSLLDSFKSDIIEKVTATIHTLKEAEVNEGETNVPVRVDGSLTGSFPDFLYAEKNSKSRRFWQVPEDFKFPSSKLRSAWRLWVVGLPEFMVENPDGSKTICPIRPFRLLNSKRLPKKLAKHFTSAWLPIMSIMSSGIESLPSDGSLSPALIDTLYEEGIKNVKSRASFCFQKQFHLSWTVSTWSGRVQHNYVKRLGNGTDIDALPSPGRNQGRVMKPGYTRKRKQQKLLFTPRRVRNTNAIAEVSNGEESA